MLPITLFMLAILVVAGFVVLYVAYPHRGVRVPGAPWLGAAMTRASAAVPTIEEGEAAEEGTLTEGPHRMLG